MCEGASRAECWRNIGREPITTKWVDASKGRIGEIQIRSRLVARDFRAKGDDRQFDVFAAMPSLEMNMILSRMAMVEGDLHRDKSGLKGKEGHLNNKKGDLNGKKGSDEVDVRRL